MLNDGQVASLVIFGPFLIFASVLGVFIHFHERSRT